TIPVGIVRSGTLGAAAPAPAAAGPTAVKLPEVADQLLEKRQLAAGRRGCPGNRRDLLSVFQGLVVDRLDYPLVVEIDDVDLLVHGCRAADKCSGARNGGEKNQESPYRDGLESAHGITQPAFC